MSSSKKIDLKNVDWKEFLKTYSLIVLGTFIMSIGYVVFVSPLKLAPGGVYGIAIILHHLFNFPIGLSGICLDIPLLIIGTLWLGPKFGAKTIVGVITLPAFISLWEKIYGYAPLIAVVLRHCCHFRFSLVVAFCLYSVRGPPGFRRGFRKGVQRKFTIRPLHFGFPQECISLGWETSFFLLPRHSVHSLSVNAEPCISFIIFVCWHFSHLPSQVFQSMSIQPHCSI